MVGRNAAIDAVRRAASRCRCRGRAHLRSRRRRGGVDQRLDGEHIATTSCGLLFICCHPELPATQQIALALRTVSGLSVKQIARAFLVGESAMEPAHHKGQVAHPGAGVPFETPAPRARRAARRRLGDDLSHLQRGYSPDRAKTGAPGSAASDPPCPAAAALFPAEPEIMGLAALLLFSIHASPRASTAPRDRAPRGADRFKWDRQAIAEGLALLDRRSCHRRRALSDTGRDRRPAPRQQPPPKRLGQIDLLYAALETLPALAGGDAQTVPSRPQDRRAQARSP